MEEMSNLPAFVYQKEFGQRVKPLQKLLDISHFHHFRILSTGHCATLSTNAIIPADLYLNRYQFPLMSKTGQIAPSGFYHSSSFMHPIHQPLWELLREKYAYDNVLFLVDNQGDYGDIFMMGSDPDNNKAMNNYLNNQEEIIKFTQNYIKEPNFMLNEALKTAVNVESCLSSLPLDTLIHSETHQTTKELIANTRKVMIKCRKHTFIITHREYQCLYYMSHGYSFKTIANILQISPRTVETHMEHTKTKSDNMTRGELIQLFWECEAIPV